MPKFLIVMCIYGIFATVPVLRGTRALVYTLKQRHYLSSFLQLLQKVQVSG